MDLVILTRRAGKHNGAVARCVRLYPNAGELFAKGCHTFIGAYANYVNGFGMNLILGFVQRNLA